LTPAVQHDCVWPDLPGAIMQSTLYRHGGVLVVADLLDVRAVDELESEALRVRAGSWRNEAKCPDVAEERGGCPSRAFAAAHAGYLQWNIFSSPALVASLVEICGLDATPLGGGSYSYYERPGDFLALHRDIVACDLTVITCLRDTGELPAGGALLVYPLHINRPLQAAREAGRCAARAVALGRGESAVLLGGVVPHEVAAMQPGQERMVSVMCYRVQGLS